YRCIHWSFVKSVEYAFLSVILLLYYIFLVFQNTILNRVDEALQKRHEIAHKGETSAILGLRDAQKYYDQAKNLILIISAIYN
ncbi:MAG: hypothetical protein SH821_00645, partial [Phototrophicales bacterium]|nr:hypothetical protein [Phototrophicales bacterium]